MPPWNRTSRTPSSESRVRSLLNKLAESNFDSIAYKIQAIFDDRPGLPGLLYRQRHEAQVKVLVEALVEAAALDSARSGLYARLCHRIAPERDPSTSEDERTWRNRSSKSATQLFQEMLLEQVQTSFEAGVKSSSKPRFLGLLRFAAELFKIELLPEKTMHEMIRTFLGDARTPSAADAEFFCTLIRAVGPYLEKEHASVQMAVYASRIREYAKSRTLPLHLRIMFQELMDLRSRKWAAPESNDSTSSSVDFETETYISLTEKSVLLGLLDPILRERDLEAAHRLLSSLCQHYIPTVIELVVRKVLVFRDESLTQFARQLLQTGVCDDLFLTSAVQAGFRLVVGDAHWKSEDVEVIVSMLEAAGLNGEIIVGDGAAEEAAAPPHSPPALDLLGAPQILHAICATLSISLPAIRSSGDVERGEFDQWLALFVEHIQSIVAATDEIHSESLSSEVTRLSQQLAQSIKRCEEVGHARDLAEKTRNSEQMRRIEAEARLRKKEEEMDKADVRIKNLEHRLADAEQRSRMLEEQLKGARLELKRHMEGEGPMKKRAHEEGRDEMLAEMAQFITSKRQEERRAREAEKERVEREANDARRREEEIKRKAERARGAESERVRCQQRDVEFTKNMFWNMTVAFQRFERILVDEDKIKFSDSVPLIFEALPWPTLARPGQYQAADITAQSVRRFFKSQAAITAFSVAYPLPRDYRKYLFKQGLLAFHEDKMLARLATVGEDALRQEIADAAKIVTQTLNDLMSETG